MDPPGQTPPPSHTHSGGEGSPGEERVLQERRGFSRGRFFRKGVLEERVLEERVVQERRGSPGMRGFSRGGERRPGEGFSTRGEGGGGSSPLLHFGHPTLGGPDFLDRKHNSKMAKRFALVL